MSKPTADYEPKLETLLDLFRRDEPAEHPEDCECKWCIVPELEAEIQKGVRLQ